MSDLTISIMIEDVLVGDRRRDINAKAVDRLAQSIEQIGLRHPITVRRRGDKYQLIAGRHRLEACKKLGREHISASIVSMAGDDARLWEIAENLHRADLTKLERDEQVTEWIRITEKRIIANCENSKPGPKSAVSAASEELGVDKDDAHRAVKVASLSEEAKEAARETGLDDNRSALLEAAAKPTVAEQVAEIHRRHASGARVVKIADDPINDLEAAEKQVAALMSAWNKASREAREEFLLRIEQPVMDRRYAKA